MALTNFFGKVTLKRDAKEKNNIKNKENKTPINPPNFRYTFSQKQA